MENLQTFLVENAGFFFWTISEQIFFLLYSFSKNYFRFFFPLKNEKDIYITVTTLDTTYCPFW